MMGTARAYIKLVVFLLGKSLFSNRMVVILISLCVILRRVGTLLVPTRLSVIVLRDVHVPIIIVGLLMPIPSSIMCIPGLRNRRKKIITRMSPAVCHRVLIRLLCWYYWKIVFNWFGLDVVVIGMRLKNKFFEHKKTVKTATLMYKLFCLAQDTQRHTPGISTSIRSCQGYRNREV